MALDLGDMRILMFARTMAMGGTEKVVLQLCRALKGKVGFLGVMSRGGELVSELAAIGVPHFEVPDITGKRRKRSPRSRASSRGLSARTA